MKEEWNNYLVVGLLMVASFVIGMLMSDIRHLKSQNGAPAVAAQPAGTDAPTQLGNSDAAKNVPKVTDADWVRGDKNAKITLIEYSDFECPFCKRFHPTMEQVMTEYKGKVKWVYRHYPLSFHQNAQPAAEAAECVGKVGGNDAFWKFADAYYEATDASGTGIKVEAMPELAAKSAGVNAAAVKKCLDSGEMAQKVKDQMAGGQTAGVQGTPGTILLTEDGQAELISGALPYEQVKAVIDRYMK